MQKQIYKLLTFLSLTLVTSWKKVLGVYHTRMLASALCLVCGYNETGWDGVNFPHSSPNDAVL